MYINECITCWEWSSRQYWQYQRRGSWRYEWHGDTLIRYVETAPADPDFAGRLLEFLKMPESVHGFSEAGRDYAGATVYNRPARLGAEWKPVSAWYEQQEGQADERTKLKLIRVYQALQKCSENGAGDGPYEVEDGCRYRVTFTYHWKVERLPSVPQGTSGVGYTLEQVSRDDETGLWSCCVVKRERVQQDVDDYETEVTRFEKRTEEQHLGVKASKVRQTGKVAQMSRGCLVKRQLRKNDDCTTDVVNETVTSRPVEGAATAVERTLRAETVTVEDRNMPEKLPETGLKPGESVRNEMTPDMRWNRKRTVTTPKVPDGPIRETCRKTAFEHQHEKVEVTGTEPSAPDVGAAAGGSIETETVRRLDDGTFERAREERREQESRGAVVETRKTLRGVKRTTVNRNMPGKATTAGMKIGGAVRNEMTEGGLWNQTIEETENTPTGKIGESCAKTALNHVHRTVSNRAESRSVNAQEAADGVIRRMEVRQTEEGTYDVTEETDTAIEKSATVKGGATHRKEERTEYRNAKKIEPPEPEPNVEVQATARTNEHGRKDGTVTVVTHKPAERRAKGGSLKRTVEVESHINEKGYGEIGGKPTGANVEVDVSASPNEHGTCSWQKRTVTHEKATGTASGGTALYDETETEGINDTERPAEALEDGKTVTCRVHPNEYGSATTSKVVRRAKARTSPTVTWKTKDERYTYTHGMTVYRNSERVPTPPSGKYQCTMSLSINEFGRYDAVVKWVERKETREGGGDAGESTSGTETRIFTYQGKDGRLYRRNVTADFTCRKETGSNLHTIMLDGAQSGFGFHSHDNGSYGIRYTNIQLGPEEEVADPVEEKK